MEVTRWRRFGHVRWCIEFKWQDLWCGVFVSKPKLVGGTEFYVCIVPMLPIHIAWKRTIKAIDYGTYRYELEYVDAQGNTWKPGEFQANP